MNDHDAVCDSVAVSSDSRNTAGHPAGQPPTVYKKTHKHTLIHNYITLLTYVADYCMLITVTDVVCAKVLAVKMDKIPHWAGCPKFRYSNRKVLKVQRLGSGGI